MMIETRGLRKSFGDHVVLGGIDLDVAAGTILALLGPNGAGKTATVQILSRLLAADGGQARVAGGHDAAREPEAVRAAIGSWAFGPPLAPSPGSRRLAPSRSLPSTPSTSPGWGRLRPGGQDRRGR